MKLPFLKSREPQVQKLAAIEAEITAALAEVQAGSLRAVLDGDESAAIVAASKLTALRERRELVLAAQRQATVEADRAAFDAQVRDYETRRRALDQHYGRVKRAAAEVTKCLSELTKARTALADAAGRIVAVIPPSMKCQALPFNDHFGEGNLRSLYELEAYRLGADTRRPVRLAEYQDRTTGGVTILSDNLAAFLESCRRNFDARSPSATPQPQSQQPVSSSSSPADSAPVPADTGSPPPLQTPVALGKAKL